MANEKPNGKGKITTYKTNSGGNGLRVETSQFIDEIMVVYPTGETLYVPSDAASAFKTNADQETGSDLEKELMRTELDVRREFGKIRDSVDEAGNAILDDKKIEMALDYILLRFEPKYALLKLGATGLPHVNPFIRKVRDGDIYRDASKQDTDEIAKSKLDDYKEFTISLFRPEDVYYKNLDLNMLGGIKGGGFTVYLTPTGQQTVGALQVLGTKKALDGSDELFIKTWVDEADTMFKEIIEKEKEIASKAGKVIEAKETERAIADAETDSLYTLRDDNEKGEEPKKPKRKGWAFYEKGSYFDISYDEINKGLIAFCGPFRRKQQSVSDEFGEPEEQHAISNLHENIKFITDVYKNRKGLNISDSDVEKDKNSAISLAKLIYGVFHKYGDKFPKEYVLPDERKADEYTLRDAAMFVGAFSRAIKYMPEADRIKSINQIREKNDIKIMTSYLATLVEIVKDGILYKHYNKVEPLVDKHDNRSLLGATIIDIAEKIDPEKQSNFTVDFIEKAIEYEERVQETTASPAQPIDKALEEMYHGCVVQGADGGLKIDKNGITAIRMIDTLVNPQGKDFYRTFEPQLKDTIKQAQPGPTYNPNPAPQNGKPAKEAIRPGAVTNPAGTTGISGYEPGPFKKQ